MYISRGLLRTALLVPQVQAHVLCRFGPWLQTPYTKARIPDRVPRAAKYCLPGSYRVTQHRMLITWGNQAHMALHEELSEHRNIQTIPHLTAKLCLFPAHQARKCISDLPLPFPPLLLLTQCTCMSYMRDYCKYRTQLFSSDQRLICTRE